MTDIQVDPAQMLIGAGFGKKPKQPTVEDDDARSTSRANIVEVISEGPCEGIFTGVVNPDARKGIYLDRTVVMNPGGTLNFQGMIARPKPGTANQLVSPTFGGIASETNVGVQVKKSTGTVTRNIINSELDAISIRIQVQLQKSEKDGDVVGSSLTFKVDIMQGATAWKNRLTKTIKGKYSSGIELAYEFPVNNQGGTIDSFGIRLSVTSDDSNDTTIRNLTWKAYTELTKTKLNYRYSATCGLQFMAEQFDSVPERAYRFAGRMVQIPSNATIGSDRGLNFSGTWNGTFTTPTKACSDPCWHLYDLLTNTRYGVGRYISADRIDVYSLYAASVYNNQMVPNGFGGTERRFQCNTMLQSKESAWEVINAFCSACNMKAYVSEGKIRFWQDRPGDVVRQFTQADIEDGKFVYSSTAVRSRFTSIMVIWNDPKDFYRRAVEPVEDKAGIARYGIQDTEITAFGCTSRGQAIRAGNHALQSSLYEKESVSFTCRSWAAFVRPGEIIQIADANRANVRYGGLIKSASTTSIVLDSAISLPGSNRKVTIMMPDGSLATRDIETNPLNPSMTNVSALDLTSPLPSVPNKESNFLISTSLVAPQLFRVLSVTPATNDPTKVEITGIEYNPGKYDFVENNVVAEEPPTNFTIPQVVPGPSSVAGSVIRISVIGGNQLTALIGTWTPPLTGGEPDPTIVGYRAEFTRTDLNNSWQGTQSLFSSQYEARWENVPADGVYYVRVCSINVNGQVSDWVVSPAIQAGPITLSLDFSGGRGLSIFTRPL
jgi:predicted phage tail protein